MNKRSMRILGFYQVQNMLVRLAPSRLSKEIARRLRPVNDSEVIERNLTDTEEAVRCMQTETSTPSAVSSISGRLWKRLSAK